MVSAVKVRSHVSSKLFQDAAPLGDCGGSECGDGGSGGRRKGPEKRGECLRRGKKKREEESRGYAKGKLSPIGTGHHPFHTGLWRHQPSSSAPVDGDGADG